MKSGEVSVNRLASVYERANIEYTIAKTWEMGLNLYPNEKTKDWLKSLGLQLPDNLASLLMENYRSVSKDRRVPVQNIIPDARADGNTHEADPQLVDVQVEVKRLPAQRHESLLLRAQKLRGHLTYDLQAVVTIGLVILIGDPASHVLHDPLHAGKGRERGALSHRVVLVLDLPRPMSDAGEAVSLLYVPPYIVVEGFGVVTVPCGFVRVELYGEAPSDALLPVHVRHPFCC